MGDRCPVTYVYQNTMGNINSFAGLRQQDAFGKNCSSDPYIFTTDQWSLTMIVLFRIYNSRRCPVTTDPEKADLFLVRTQLWERRDKLQPPHPTQTSN